MNNQNAYYRPNRFPNNGNSYSQQLPARPPLNEHFRLSSAASVPQQQQIPQSGQYNNGGREYRDNNRDQRERSRNYSNQGYRDDRRDNRPHYPPRERYPSQFEHRGHFGHQERDGNYGGDRRPPPNYFPMNQVMGPPDRFDRRRFDKFDERPYHYEERPGYYDRSVMNFYNQKKGFNREQRKVLETLPIRIFHNWIKSVLIQKYGEKQRELIKKEAGIGTHLPENYLYVLDVACGKGGDHKKWLLHSHTAFYVGVDIAFESLNEAHKRALKTLEEIKMSSRYHSNIKFGFFGKDATCSREDFWKYIIRSPEEEEAADPLKKQNNSVVKEDVPKIKQIKGNGQEDDESNLTIRSEEDQKANKEHQIIKNQIPEISQQGKEKQDQFDIEEPNYNEGERETANNYLQKKEEYENFKTQKFSYEQPAFRAPTTIQTQNQFLFDIVSCQMSLHYMLESEESARNFLDNCTYRMNEKGYLLLTFTDSAKIINLVRSKGKAVSADEEDGAHVFKNKHFSLRFEMSADQIEQQFEENIFGVNFDFYLQESVGSEVEGQVTYVPEYLVDVDNFIQLAKEYSLEVKENSNFVDFYKSNRQEYVDLLRSMKVPYSQEEDLRDPQTWEISHCYRVLVFQKLKGSSSRLKFDRSTRDKYLYKYPIPFNFFPKKRTE